MRLKKYVICALIVFGSALQGAASSSSSSCPVKDDSGAVERYLNIQTADNKQFIIPTHIWQQSTMLSDLAAASSALGIADEDLHPVHFAEITGSSFEFLMQLMASNDAYHSALHEATALLADLKNNPNDAKKDTLLRIVARFIGLQYARVYRDDLSMLTKEVDEKLFNRLKEYKTDLDEPLQLAEALLQDAECRLPYKLRSFLIGESHLRSTFLSNLEHTDLSVRQATIPDFVEALSACRNRYLNNTSAGRAVQLLAEVERTYAVMYGHALQSVDDATIAELVKQINFLSISGPVAQAIALQANNRGILKAMARENIEDSALLNAFAECLKVMRADEQIRQTKRSYIHASSFEVHPHQLITYSNDRGFSLDLSSCNIQHASQIKNFLQWLGQDRDQKWHIDLHFNELTVLEEDTFCKQDNIASINLSVNKICRIEPGAFKDLPCLQRLDLSSNLIESLPQDLAINCKGGYACGPSEVDLHNNRISSIDENAFTGLQLKKLNLAFNRLSQLSSAWLKGQNRLTHLHASNNAIERLISHDEVRLNRLNELNLMHNRLAITSLYDVAVFVGYPDLREGLTNLNLSNNNIRFLAPPNLTRDFSSHESYAQSHMKAHNADLLVQEVMRSVVRLDLSHNEITGLKGDWHAGAGQAGRVIDGYFNHKRDVQSVVLNLNGNRLSPESQAEVQAIAGFEIKHTENQREPELIHVVPIASSSLTATIEAVHDDQEDDFEEEVPPRDAGATEGTCTLA